MHLSLCTRMLEDRRLEDAIQIAAEAGYDGVELMGRVPHLPPETSMARVRELRRRIADRGLTVSCLATYTGGYSQLEEADCQQQLEQLQRFAEMATELSCPLVRVWAGGPEPEQAAATHWQRAAEGLQRAAEIAASYGVHLGLELHYGYLHRDLPGICRLLQLIGRPEVGVIYDPANLYVAGTDYGPAVVRRLGRHILHVHVKDSVRTDAAGPGVMGPPPYLYRSQPLGQGMVDYSPILAALREIGYTGYLSSEARLPLGDSRALAEHERQTMARLLAEVHQECSNSRD